MGIATAIEGADFLLTSFLITESSFIKKEEI
jgi:hypothetical protein